MSLKLSPDRGVEHSRRVRHSKGLHRVQHRGGWRKNRRAIGYDAIGTVAGIGFGSAWHAPPSTGALGIGGLVQYHTRPVTLALRAQPGEPGGNGPGNYARDGAMVPLAERVAGLPEDTWGLAGCWILRDLWAPKMAQVNG